MWREAVQRMLKRARHLPIAGRVSVAIFGSCVTRDLFEQPALRETLQLYAARCSVISAVAPPVGIDCDRVKLSSGWQRRCVVADFRKTFFTSLAELRPDWLVIDLIDERFDLLRGSASLVTRSSAFTAAGLDDDPGLDFEPVKRTSVEGCDLFERAAVDFADRVTEVVPPERVVLHRALWCLRYRTGGQVLPFGSPRIELCRRQNAMLDHGYKVMRAAFGDRAANLELDPATRLADADHRWALEPYHYDSDYNAEAVAQLQGMFGLR